MPINTNLYSETVFYKIACKNKNIIDIYVGFTTNFKTKNNQHKYDCINEKSSFQHLKLYQFIKENGGYENWRMILIKRHSCVDVLDAHRVQNHYIEILGATLNTEYKPFSIQDYQKKYYEANKLI
jgi:hypothetical protein